MIEAFKKATGTIKNPYVAEWVEGGKKVMGYTCSFIPPEIFHAVDILPYRLRGHGAESMEIADTYIGPFACSFPKCLLQVIGEGQYRFLDGAIISSSCDSIRRLDENWRFAGRDIPDITPEFFHYFDVPFKILPHTMEWYIAELKKLIQKVEEHFNVSITEEKLKKSIEEFNTSRKLLADLEQLRCSDNIMISGTDTYNTILAGTVMPRDLYNKSLKKLIINLRKKKKSILNGGKRIMVSGSICDDADLIEAIEQSGSIVVAESICFGIRGAADIVSTDDDPVEALARRYMQGSVCPRFLMSHNERINYLKEKAQSAKVEGIILENVRFCDLHGSENALIERAFEEIDIPAMRLEREHGPLNEMGRVKMRIDAFLNRI